MAVIGPVLDRFIEAEHTEREPDGKWHPSSLGLCARQAVLGKLGIEKTDPSTIESKRNFFQGHLIHEVVQEALHADPSFDEVYSEVELAENPLGIAGHADGLVRVGDKWHVLELKSKGSKHWYNDKRGKKVYYKSDGPEPHHLIQAGAYALVLSRWGGIATRDKMTVTIPPLGDKIVAIDFAYISKVNFEVREYQERVTEELYDSIVDLIGMLDHEIAQGDLPPVLPLVKGRDGMEKAWPCRYGCEWASLCWPI